MPDKAAENLFQALEMGTSRLKYSIQLVEKRLSKFEKKYAVASEEFISEWSAEDLEGKDLEYVEWAGEYRLATRLNEHLSALEGLKHVPS